MPMGTHTVIGEGLSTLSGGERQRIPIAAIFADFLARDPRAIGMLFKR